MVIKYESNNCLFSLGGEFLTLDEIGDGNYVKPKAPSPTGSTHKESSIWMCSQFLYCTSQHMYVWQIIQEKKTANSIF